MRMVILDVKSGHLKSRISNDKVILKGMYPFEKGQLADELEINLYLEGDEKVVKQKVPYGGYYVQLFLGDFLGNGTDNILVKGRFPGSGGIAILVLYEYKDGKLEEIANQWTIGEINKKEVRYLENYKVEINYGAGEKYILDISSRSKSYLNLIYGEDGKIKENVNPEISDINDYYEIKEWEIDKYDLLVRQRIIGVVLVDTLGVLQSTISFNKKGEFSNKNRELVIFEEGKFNW